MKQVDFKELAYEPTDLAALRAFYAALYVASFPDADERESLDNMGDYLRRKASGWYGSNNYHIVLGLSDGAVVAASICDYLAEPNVGVIEFLLVSPAARGGGMGRRLLDHTEALLDQDARRGRGRPLDCVLAEMNDPLAESASADNFDPVARALIWHGWGFRRLAFPYVQPALSVRQSAVTNLLLICRPLREGWSAGVPSQVVVGAVHEYMRWAMRIELPDHNVEFREMVQVLTQTDSIDLQSLDGYAGSIGVNGP